MVQKIDDTPPPEMAENWGTSEQDEKTCLTLNFSVLVKVRQADRVKVPSELR